MSAPTNQRIDPRLMEEGRRTRKTLYAAIALSVAAAVVVIAQAILLAHVVRDVVFGHQAPPALAPRLWGLAALFCLRAALTHASEIAAFRASAAIKTHLRTALLDHILRLGPVHAANEQSADLAGTMIEGIEALEPYFSRYLPQLALVVAIPVAILALVFPVDWISGLILLCAGPLIPLFMVFVGYRAQAINQQQWQKLLLMSAHVLDMVQGLTTLKLFGRARDEIAIVARVSDDYRRATMAGLRVAFLSAAVLEFFASLSIALVAVVFGARLLHGTIDFYPAFLVLLLAPEFFVPLRGLATHYHARMSAIAAASRMFDVLDTPIPPTGTTPLPAQSKLDITCEDLHFAYNDAAPVLAGLTCRFQAQKITAIVGASGAGKTTLARLLLAFARPSQGRILINNTLDLASLAPESWWRNLAWVPQNPRLFHGTIAANIRLGNPLATDESVHHAAAQARAKTFIDAQPRGFDTIIGDLGQGLSGGQIQRIALARAFLKNPQLLILDEATANLDLESEALILEALTEQAARRTVIVIAHRLATAERADHVLVLDSGRAAAFGTPAQLRAAGSTYARLLAAHQTPARLTPEPVPCG